MIEKKIPLGGLNVDDSPDIFPSEDYQSAQNVSIVLYPDGNVAAVKNIPGNRNIGASGVDDPVIDGFSDDFKAVAKLEVPSERRTYYFVTHTPTGGSNYILMYDWVDQDVSIVLAPSTEWVSFSGNPITGIDKVGDILYWAEWGVDPKKINVERGLKTFDSGYVSPDGTTPVPYDTSDLSEKDFTIIRPAPVYPLTIEKTTSGSAQSRVMANSYQFAYRYIYREGEVSVLSPYSKLAAHADDDSDDTYNAIQVTVPPQETFSNEIQRIEFLVRYGNIGSWSVFYSVDRRDNETAITNHNDGTLLDFYFFDDRAGIPVSDTESSKMFDSVPVTSEALVAARNRLFLGNNRIGYTLPDNRTLVKFGIDEAGDTSVTGTYRLVKFQINDSGIPYHVLVVHISGAPSGDGYYFVRYYPPGESVAAFTGATLPTSVTLSSGDRLGDSTISDNELQDLCNDLLLDRYGVDLDDTTTFPAGYTASTSTYTGPAVNINGIGSFSENYKKFKAGGAYQFGIVYFDRFLRNAGVVTDTSHVVNIPERTYSDVQPVYAINFLIYPGQEDTIPDWAYYYAIVRTKDLTRQSFFQHISDDILYIKKDNEGAYDFTGASNTFTANDTEYIAFGISPANNDGLGYQYTAGDKLVAWSPNEASSPNKFEFPIVGQSGNYIIVEKPEDLGDTSAGDNQWMLIEVYTPRRPTSEEIFYEVGENFYFIDNPGTASKAFSIRVGGMYAGDVYVKTRDVSGVDVSLDDLKAEAMNPSDANWTTWDSDIGRGHSVLLRSASSRPSTQEHRPNSIVYSNQWLPGAARNGLSSFEALDYRDIDDTNGPIRKLVLASQSRQMASVMLAICENEVSSIYLGETQLVDNAGDAIIATSGDVIGTINNLRGGTGTLHPESVVEENGVVYWWDAINGEVSRYSSEGIVPVSEYKMSRYFRALGPLSRDYDMPATYNRRDNTYLLAIPVSPLSTQVLTDYDPGRTSPHLIQGQCVLAFHAPTNRWVSKYSFYPTMMAMAGNDLLSWDGGRLYLHDSNYNTFYGTSSPSFVSFLINGDPFSVKILQSIAVEANQAPDWVHFRNEKPYTQSSDIEDDEFTDREGIYYASVMRDRRTPGFDSEEEAWYSGDTIRGQHPMVAVQFEEYGAEIVFRAITVNYTESYGHQKARASR